VLFSKPPGATTALSSILAPFWTLAFAGVTLFDSFEIGSLVFISKIKTNSTSD
jgi:hypothetical protein